MTSGIIVILAALVPFLVQILAARIAKDNNPITKESSTNERIDEDIAKHNAGDVTLLLNQQLGQLQNSGSGNP